MTALARILAARIAAEGPITLADYMAECLMHPAHGYYSTRDPFGAAGDFTTAPEISQMFGEILGLCLAQSWIDQGRPTPFCLAEVGPGRGTLMADMLRAMSAVPGLMAAARVHLVEASPVLRQSQATTLGRQEAVWHAEVTDLPDLPLFLVANEFFDALPIRQFVRQGAGWAEKRVGLRDGALVFGLAPPVAVAALTARLATTPEGTIVEVCPALPAIAEAIGARIARHGGAALVIDYGDWGGHGDTLQAVRAHRYTPPLDGPGSADLTAHVDFAALATAFVSAGAQATAMVPQGVFLERLGIGLRAGALARRLSGAARLTHDAAHRRLTHPAEMGQLFKVIACYRANCPLPPGLDPA